MAKKKSYDEFDSSVLDEVEEFVKLDDDKSDLEKKIETILKSKMPEDQKKAYIADLCPKEKEKVNRVSFSVYAKIRKIKKNLAGGMLAFPKAVGVKFASLKEWDEIFKDF